MNNAACAFHPEKASVEVCSRCGDFICLECRRFTPTGQLFCPKCNPAEGASKAGQLKILGILLIIHGGLLLFMAVIGVAGVGMTGSITETMARDPNMAAGGAEGLGYMLYAVYGVIALIALVVGPLQVWAGISALRRTRRTLIFVALAGGLTALITVYCAPTALALAIWGLILLSRDDVKRAFEKS
jgi:hypothetical protein